MPKITRLVPNTILQVLHRYIPSTSVETTKNRINVIDDKGMFQLYQVKPLNYSKYKPSTDLS